MAEQIGVADPFADPAVRGGEGKREDRILVLSERALERNEPVAGGLAAIPLPAERPRDGVALDVARERHRNPGWSGAPEPIAPLPVLVHQVAVTQVGDALAA